MMENTIRPYLSFGIPVKARRFIFDIVSFALVLLFMYTASSKLLEWEKFSETLETMPLIGTYHVLLAFGIPLLEIIISLLLIVPVTKRLGLWMAFGLLMVFTAFLVYMVYTVEFLPCSCGGVSARLSWMEQIVFNAAFIVAAGIGLGLTRGSQMK